MPHKLLQSIALAISASVALTTVGATPAIAKPLKYNFAGGSMYTVEYVPEHLLATTDVRIGRISRNGTVTAISDDWNLQRVSDADYSSETGLVYLLVNGKPTNTSFPCSIFTWDPDSPEVDPTKLSDLSDISGALCGALSVTDAERILVGRSDYPNRNILTHHNIFSGSYVSDASSDLPETSALEAIDRSSVGKTLLVQFDGRFEFTGAGTFRTGNLPRSGYTSVKFDTSDRPWILRTKGIDTVVGKPNVVGLLNVRKKSVAWGPALRDSQTRRLWLTESLIFIPRTG